MTSYRHLTFPKFIWDGQKCQNTQRKFQLFSMMRQCTNFQWVHSCWLGSWHVQIYYKNEFRHCISWNITDLCWNHWPICIRYFYFILNYAFSSPLFLVCLSTRTVKWIRGCEDIIKIVSQPQSKSKWTMSWRKEVLEYFCNTNIRNGTLCSDRPK